MSTLPSRASSRSFQSSPQASAFHTFHFTSCLFCFFFFSTSVSLSLCMHPPTSVFLSFFFAIFHPFYLAITPTLSITFFSFIFLLQLPTHLQIVRLAASGLFHSIKARVLLLLLPLIMKALRLACCQAVTGTIINRRHPSSPSPAITGLITII